MIWNEFVLYLIGINILTFCVYGIDKRRAIRKQWRISEKMLFFLALIGGSIGALAGMQMFRHKTKHVKFKLGIPAILIVQAGILYWIMK
ncbi:MAG: DUF1294 domain-containing protein [Bariatricus sp.]